MSATLQAHHGDFGDIRDNGPVLANSTSRDEVIDYRTALTLVDLVLVRSDVVAIFVPMVSDRTFPQAAFPTHLPSDKAGTSHSINLCSVPFFHSQVRWVDSTAVVT